VRSFGTSIIMSMRSRSGPEIFFWYLMICSGRQVQGLVGSVLYPQGQGFCAAMSMKCEG